MINYIFPLSPNRVWRTYSGGKIIDQLYHAEEPLDDHFPEDWIASLTTASNPGREEMINEGLSCITLDGEELLFKELISTYPKEVLGEKHYERFGAHTAFLLKFLDSAERLHLQCHPTITFAKKYLNSNHGKTEGYYILATREEVEVPFIYMGFQKPPSIEKFKRAIEDQDIEFLESCFEKIPVKAGDAFFVPGGMPHAIGEGVFMIEIMEPTDLVVRIEFEKAGYILPEKARFMDRGIDFALSMFDYSPVSIEAIRDRYFIKQKQVLVTPAVQEHAIFDPDITDCFRLNKLHVKGSHLLVKDSFYILIVIDGSGEIRSGTEGYDLRAGNKFFIPACTTSLELISSDGITLMIAMPPAL